MPEHLDVKDRHDCPACADRLKLADAMKQAKHYKVYGRVSANSRRLYASNQRNADRLYTELFREHAAALRNELDG